MGIAREKKELKKSDNLNFLKALAWGFTIIGIGYAIAIIGLILTSKK